MDFASVIRQVIALALSLILFPAYAGQVTVSLAGFTATGSDIVFAAQNVAEQYNAQNYSACEYQGTSTARFSTNVQSIDTQAKTVTFRTISVYFAQPQCVDNPPLIRTVSYTETENCSPEEVKKPDGSCVSKCSVPPISTIGLANGDGSKAATACIGGCSYELGFRTSGSGTGTFWSPAGKACSGAEVAAAPAGQTPASVPADANCGPGQGRVSGVVNGLAVNKCVPLNVVQSDKSSTSSSSSSASGASGSGTISNSSGTTSSTKCVGTTCTTTTTTTTSDSDGTTKTDEKTTSQPKSDFCTTSPKDPICKFDDGSWGGSCGSFSCDGDAVTCAIAQASWKSACALDIEPTDSKVQSGNAALTGGDRPAGHPGNNPSSSLFTANLDQTNPYGSTCPADIPLNVMGNVVSIPLSSACDTFKFMGQVAVAFTLLAAAFVIFGGVKG